MNTPLPQNKGQRRSQQIKCPMRRQTVRLGAVKIDGKRKCHGTVRLRGQDAHAPRLDPTADRFGTIGGDSARRAPDKHPVIRNECGTKRHHFKRKRRLACAGRAQDQQALPPERDAGGVKQFWIFNVHGGNLYTAKV